MPTELHLDYSSLVAIAARFAMHDDALLSPHFSNRAFSLNSPGSPTQE